MHCLVRSHPNGLFVYVRVTRIQCETRNIMLRGHPIMAPNIVAVTYGLNTPYAPARKAYTLSLYNRFGLFARIKSMQPVEIFDVRSKPK